jgi:hypothetical protein
MTSEKKTTAVMMELVSLGRSEVISDLILRLIINLNV